MIGLRLKPGFHMIVRIASIVPVVSNNVQTIGTIIWKRYQDDRKRPAGDDKDDLDRLDRIEFYPNDREDRVNFEAIIWKRFQTTETIKKIEAIPEIITFIPVIGGKIGLDGAEA